MYLCVCLGWSEYAALCCSEGPHKHIGVHYGGPARHLSWQSWQGEYLLYTIYDLQTDTYTLFFCRISVVLVQNLPFNTGALYGFIRGDLREITGLGWDRMGITCRATGQIDMELQFPRGNLPKGNLCWPPIVVLYSAFVYFFSLQLVTKACQTWQRLLMSPCRAMRLEPWSHAPDAVQRSVCCLLEIYWYWICCWQNFTKFNAALQQQVLSNKPAKCEVDWMNRLQNMQRKERQTERQRFLDLQLDI